MAISLTKRSFNPRRSRRLTTFVSLLWLNLAMLPCTMVANGEEHASQPDCPQAAQAAHHEHMSGHATTADHRRHDAGAGHAEHESPATNHPCMAEDDCCELDDVLFSDGAKKLERDSGAMPLLSVESIDTESLFESVRSLRATGPPPQFAGAVRRHALNCVYRD